MAESELVSNFTSSMKPFFLRAVPKPGNFKHLTERAETEPAEVEKNEEVGEQEIIGGDNVTPRVIEGSTSPKNFVNDAGFDYDPIPYKQHMYSGTDDYVKAKIARKMQGYPIVRKASSMAKLRKDMPAEEVIGSYQSRSRYGKSFKIRDGDAMMFRRTGNDWVKNAYDPETEPP